MNEHTYQAIGIVLKRVNVNETDRIVTLITKEHGKLVVVAKGCRRLQSSKLACLEPGNICKLYLIKTKSLPLLTQAQILLDSFDLRINLTKIRQLTQVLEIFDRLFLEDNAEEQAFSIALKVMRQLNTQVSYLEIQKTLNELLISLGYQQPQTATQNSDTQTSILDLVAQICEKKMVSFAYLKL